MNYFQIVSKSPSEKVAYDVAGNKVYIPNRLRSTDGGWGIQVTNQIGMVKKDAQGETLLGEDGQPIPVLDENGQQKTQPREELSFIGSFQECVAAKNTGAIARKAEEKLIESLANEFLAGMTVPTNLATAGV